MTSFIARFVLVGFLACLAGVARAAQQPDVPAATAPAAAPAEDADAGGADTVVVTAVDGNARARTTPEAPWQRVAVGMRLPRGAEVQTNARSRVVCEIPPGREFVVDRLSTVTVLEADRRGNKATTELLMEYGRTDLRVQAAGLEHDARIRTPGATASVRGTELSVYDQPPFAPELRTYTGLVNFRHAKRQLSVGKGGRSSGGRGAAETALLESVVDPGVANARTNAESALISQEVSRGAVLTYDPDIRINELRGGAGPQTDAALLNSLPGRLNFVVRWDNDVDVDIVVTVQPGDPLAIIQSGVFNPQTVLYPGFGLETAGSGGRIPYNHRGGPRGAQEICFWPDQFPTAVYGFSALNNSTSTSADVRFNAFLDGEKISMYTFDSAGDLIRSKGVRRTLAPEGTHSNIVLVPPDAIFEGLLPESPDETLDGTLPGSAQVAAAPVSAPAKVRNASKGKGATSAAKASKPKGNVRPQKFTRENRANVKPKPAESRRPSKQVLARGR